MKHWLIATIFIMLLFSCNTQEVCDDDNQSILVAKFKSNETGKISDTTLAGLTIFGIREGKADSLLYNLSTAARIELPLNPGDEHSVYVMTAGEKSDTLTIHHSSEAYLISYNCGFAARFTVGSCTSTGDLIIDMELINPLVDAELKSNEDHLWIYF